VVLVGEERLVVDALAAEFDESLTIELVGAAASLAELAGASNGDRAARVRLGEGTAAIPVDALPVHAIAADVIVVDVPADDDDGDQTALVAAAARAGLGAPVLALVDDVSPSLARQVLRAGASAFVPKTATTLELIDAVQRLALGDISMPASLLSEIVRTSETTAADDADLHDRLAQLTPRERDVLQKIVDGLRPAEIADALFISAHTVRSHTRGIFAKLGARSHLEAMSLALRGGHRPSSGRTSPNRHPYDATALDVRVPGSHVAGGTQ
jgi:DNA-binding NarL/FixJ family response regulator